MEKIKNFMDKWVEWDMFCSQCFALVILLIVSIGIQSFVFWISEMYQSVTNLGLYLDAGLFVLTLILVTLLLDSSQLFPFKETELKKGTKLKGKICIFIAYLAVIGFYIFVICPTGQWCLLIILCYILFLGNWIMLKKLNADADPVHIALGIGLIYCLGTYFAMLINGIEPIITVGELLFIAVATVIEWFNPAFN